jgi:hypothetical protein
MERKRAAGARLIASIAAGLLLCAGAVPLPPVEARDADPSGAAAWSEIPRDKLGPSVRPAAGPVQDGPGGAAFRPDGGRQADRPADALESPMTPEEPKIVDPRLGRLAPLKFATNYVDGTPDARV